MKKVKQNTKTAFLGTLLASALMMVMFVGFNSEKVNSQDGNAIESSLLADNMMSSEVSFDGKCGDDKTKEEKATKEEKSSKDAKATKDSKSGEAKEEVKEEVKEEGKCGEGKCGEGKCGDDKAKEGEKSGESKCGEGKCGK